MQDFEYTLYLLTSAFKVRQIYINSDLFFLDIRGLRLLLWLRQAVIVSIFLEGFTNRENKTLSVCAFIVSYIRLEWIYTLWWPEFQGTPCSKQVRYLKCKGMQRDPNPQPRECSTIRPRSRVWDCLQTKWSWVQISLKSLKPQFPQNWLVVGALV